MALEQGAAVTVLGLNSSNSNGEPVIVGQAII
jgi:hypothetical protein